MTLPGQESHYKMAPLARLKQLREEAIRTKNPREAAVLMLYYPDNEGQTRFVLIHRKTYPGVHSNQVGFPGGKIEEEDRNMEHTALRETCEEIGIRPQQIDILCPLTEIYIPPSNFLVYPFMGIMNDTPEFTPQEDEVENIIEVLLSDFLNDEILFSEKLTTSYAKEISVPAFKLNGYTVWGATAMMLNEVKELLKSAF